MSKQFKDPMTEEEYLELLDKYEQDIRLGFYPDSAKLRIIMLRVAKIETLVRELLNRETK